MIRNNIMVSSRRERREIPISATIDVQIWNKIMADRCFLLFNRLSMIRMGCSDDFLFDHDDDNDSNKCK